MPSSARAGTPRRRSRASWRTTRGGPITSTVNNSCVGLKRTDGPRRRHRHRGLSACRPGWQVSDFISNTGIRVQSIATNFNGRTNVVRADSILLLECQTLRLKATSCTLAANLASCLIGGARAWT